MWLPRNSRGSSWAVQRFIVWRSRESMQSETQIREQRLMTPRSTRPPPEEQDSISTSGNRSLRTSNIR